MRRRRKGYIADQIFAVTQEKRAGQGEDALFAECRGTMAAAAVFDGCGGSGAKRYQMPRGEQQVKGAWIASRAASAAVRGWFHRQGEAMGESAVLGQEIKNAIDNELHRWEKTAQEISSGIRSPMLRDFPTTVAIALVQRRADRVELDVIWAGDSRIYRLDQDGMVQLTVDDANEEGGAMRNVACTDKPYHLNERVLRIDRPCIIFAATDGAYAYFQNQAEFERFVLERLWESGTPKDFEKKLKDSFRERRHPDDVTLVLLSIGFGSFQRTQAELADRLRQLEQPAVGTGRR